MVNKRKQHILGITLLIAALCVHIILYLRFDIPLPILTATLGVSVSLCAICYFGGVYTFVTSLVYILILSACIALGSLTNTVTLGVMLFAMLLLSGLCGKTARMCRKALGEQKRRRARGDDVRVIGCLTDASFMYEELKQIFTMKPGDYRRLDDRGKRTRSIITAVLEFVGMSCIYIAGILDNTLTDGKLSVPDFIYLAGLAVCVYGFCYITHGFRRGFLLCAVLLLCIPAYFAYSYTVRLSFGVSTPVGVLWVTASCLLFLRLAYDLIRKLDRGRYICLEPLSRHDGLYCVPLHITVHGESELVVISLKFKPTRRAARYFLLYKPGDLYRFCEVFGYTLAGVFSPSLSPDTVYYYIYVPKGSGAQSRLRRYIGRWDGEIISADTEDDGDYKKYRGMEPDHGEILRLYAELAVPPLSGEGKRTIEYNAVFGNGGDADSFIAAARDRLRTVERYENGKEGEDGYSCTLSLAAEVAMTLEEVNSLTSYLCSLADKHGGIIDGWYLTDNAD